MSRYPEQEIEQHLRYLSETLIPDLKDGGSEQTALDFQICVAMIEQLIEESTERLVPHHFSCSREGQDSLRLEAWNEDGSHVRTIALSDASALDLIAAVANGMVGP